MVKSSTVVASKHSEEMTTDFEFYDSNIDPIFTEVDTVIPLDESKLKCNKRMIFYSSLKYTLSFKIKF